jgi:hypothetical protein
VEVEHFCIQLIAFAIRYKSEMINKNTDESVHIQAPKFLLI